MAEAYPELRASENFQNLQNELAETENWIAVSRQIYNDGLTYNNKVQQIPTNIVASMTGFEIGVLRGRARSGGSPDRRFLTWVGSPEPDRRPARRRTGDGAAKSFWMSEADVEIVVNDDGSLSITESLTYDFDGDFSGPTGTSRFVRARPSATCP